MKQKTSLMTFFRNYKYVFLFLFIVCFLIYYFIYHIMGPCNTFPAMGHNFFHSRCVCIGKVTSSGAKYDPRYSITPADPFTVSDKCVGVSVFKYYVFQTNWPYVNQQIGDVKVFTKSQAYKVCKKAAPLLAGFSPENVREEAQETYLNNCLRSANKTFLF